MGLRDWLTLKERVTALAEPSRIASPWAGTPRAQIVWSDIFGSEHQGVTRAEAMRVPAIVKGRALILGTLARQPLAKFKGETQVAADPWMYRTNSQVPPQTRMAWTLDDLIFYGHSLWMVERGAKHEILDAYRVPPEYWEITEDLQILVDHKPVAQDGVIYFSGPQDGLLEMGRNGIRAAIAMETSWAQRVDGPVPIMELHQTDTTSTLTTEEIVELLDEWDYARKNGGTAYTPFDVELKVHTGADENLFVEGRNASRIDVANWMALPGTMLDASRATASLTYSTTEGARNELVDYSIAFWATPIEARLSQDDVVARGTRTAFDMTYFSSHEQPTTGPTSED